jgi:hypothetical protein
MNVLQAYRSLSAEQKHALRDKKIQMNRPIGELLDFLKPLAVCDTMADAVRTKLGCTFGVGIVLTIAAVIFAMNAWTIAVTLLVVVVLALTIALGWLWSWTRRIDVSNNFRKFVLPVLSVLREDIDPAHPVHVDLDLTSPTAPNKKQSEGAPFKHGAYHKIIDTMYADDWMTVDARLVDGTKLSWHVSDSIRERKKTKKNPRGKIKTKTKYAKKTDLEVSISLLKKTYALHAPSDGEMTSDEKRNTISMQRRVRSASLDPIDPRALLDLVADVFRGTTPAAKEAGA